MRTLLAITGAIESGTGLALVIVPSWLVEVLLGSALDSPAGLVIGRVLGASLFTLGGACWLARNDAQGGTTAGLIATMSLYNIAVASLLGYAYTRLGMSGVGLWPAILLHAALGVWCVASFLMTRRKQSDGL